MYSHCYEKMVEAGVAKEFTEPVCIDGNGCECEEEKSYGRKVTHISTHPEMCIIGVEIGTNTSQKCDGHKGGKKFLVQKGSTPPPHTYVNQRLPLSSYGADYTHWRTGHVRLCPKRNQGGSKC